jgi:hypothetical protein
MFRRDPAPNTVDTICIERSACTLNHTARQAKLTERLLGRGVSMRRPRTNYNTDEKPSNGQSYPHDVSLGIHLKEQKIKSVGGHCLASRSQIVISSQDERHIQRSRQRRQYQRYASKDLHEVDRNQ